MNSLQQQKDFTDFLTKHFKDFIRYKAIYSNVLPFDIISYQILAILLIPYKNVDRLNTGEEGHM